MDGAFLGSGLVSSADTVGLEKCFTHIHQCLFAPSLKIILLSCPLLGTSQSEFM